MSTLLPWLVAAVGAACVARVGLLVYELRRGRDLIWRPGRDSSGIASNS